MLAYGNGSHQSNPNVTLCKNVITAEDILMYGVQKMEETVILGFSVEKS